MKEKFELLRKVLADPAAAKSLKAAAAMHKHYVGKKILGQSFICTEGSLIGAASECGENNLHKFFDGINATVGGKKVSEWMEAYAPFTEAEKPAEPKAEKPEGRKL